MTAIEFLIDTWVKTGTLKAKDMSQAKEMEKQQIINAWNDVGADGVTTAEQYYNQTFKSEL